MFLARISLQKLFSAPGDREPVPAGLLRVGNQVPLAHQPVEGLQHRLGHFRLAGAIFGFFWQRPESDTVIFHHCLEIFAIQASMLENRLRTFIALEMDQQRTAERRQIAVHDIVGGREKCVERSKYHKRVITSFIIHYPRCARKATIFGLALRKPRVRGC